MKKPTPEELERLKEQGRRARENMQEIIDRVEARREAERERRLARRNRLRRLFGLSPRTS
jgi:hypothetical protein